MTELVAPGVRAPDATRDPWPDLFLAGAAVAGIADLRSRLLRHPDVFLATPDEPHFFSGIRPSRRFARAMPVVADESAYLALFAGDEAVAARVRGEASTSYLWSADAPDRIAAAVPEARIVLLLRDPIERAWAHHRQDLADRSERRGFLRAVRDELRRPGTWGHDQVYLGAGFYADGLDRFLDRFGRGRVWVDFHETFRADPDALTRELLTWLGLDPDHLASAPRPSAATRPAPRPATAAGRWLDALRGRSSTVPPDEPVMDEVIRRMLEDVYAADVARVTERLGVIPPWTLAPAL